jgi:hypothetical protein
LPTPPLAFMTVIALRMVPLDRAGSLQIESRGRECNVPAEA